MTKLKKLTRHQLDVLAELHQGSVIEGSDRYFAIYHITGSRRRVRWQTVRRLSDGGLVRLRQLDYTSLWKITTQGRTEVRRAGLAL